MEIRGIFGIRKRSKGPTGEKIPEKHEGLPSSDLPHGLCPRCHKQSSFEVVGSAPVTFDPDLQAVDRVQGASSVPLDQVTILNCRNCNQGVVVVEEQWIGDRSWRDQADGYRTGRATWKGIHWWPNAQANISEDVPRRISDVFREAVVTAQAQCPRAAAVMARRTLEAIVDDKGKTDKTLAAGLDAMARDGILTPEFASWAREIRLVGNVGAHFDPIETISGEDAEQLIKFVRELLRYIYELPADFQRKRRS